VKQCDRTLAWRDRLMLAADPRSTLQGSAVRSAASLVHVLIRRHACRVRGRRMGHWGGGWMRTRTPARTPGVPSPHDHDGRWGRSVCVHLVSTHHHVPTQRYPRLARAHSHDPRHATTTSSRDAGRVVVDTRDDRAGNPGAPGSGRGGDQQQLTQRWG
jgi:hypothetical protein